MNKQLIYLLSQLAIKNNIPRYILFDQNGKIIDEYAPRPSSEAPKTLISKNLN